MQCSSHTLSVWLPQHQSFSSAVLPGEVRHKKITYNMQHVAPVISLFSKLYLLQQNKSWTSSNIMLNIIHVELAWYNHSYVMCLCSIYPFLGLVFLFGGRVHSFYNPFDAEVGCCTKDGQPQQHAHHFVSGQGPHKGLSWEIFKQHLCWPMSVHWLDKDGRNWGIKKAKQEEK